MAVGRVSRHLKISLNFHENMLIDNTRTDPDTFEIQLVNQNVYPPTTEVVAANVDSSSGSYTVDAKTFNGVDTG